MNDNKVLSSVELQAEWEEIQAAQLNPAQFRPLYNRYYEPIFRYIFRRTSLEDLSADICSQVFLKAMQRLKSYEFKSVPFSAWLYRIASNEIAQHYRIQKKTRIVSLEDQQVTELFEEIDTAHSTEGQLNDLIAMLNELKETDLQLIEMRFFEQRPFKEIADILEITEANAKMKTYRILERMRKKHL